MENSKIYRLYTFVLGNRYLSWEDTVSDLANALGVDYGEFLDHIHPGDNIKSGTTRDLPATDISGRRIPALRVWHKFETRSRTLVYLTTVKVNRDDI